MSTSKKTPGRGAPRTASKASDREPLTIGGSSVPAGHQARFDLPVARLVTGTWLPLSVIAVHGAHPGPSIWISAAIHGDELNGIPIIHSVLQSLDPQRLKGTVIAVPTVNVFGLLEKSRYLPDRRDLNRSFPGSKRGSLASQLAILFMEEIASKCETGIDLHTGSDGRINLPQIRCDLEDPTTAELGRCFGAPVILHSGIRAGSLRGSARDAGTRVLVYEAGEALRFDEDAINIGVAGVRRVLQALEMIDDSVPAPTHPTIEATASHWVRAGRSGFCRMSVRLGQTVEKGQTLARIFDAMGEQERRVVATKPGLVIGLINTALVYRGDAVAHVAQTA